MGLYSCHGSPPDVFQHYFQTTGYFIHREYSSFPVSACPTQRECPTGSLFRTSTREMSSFWGVGSDEIVVSVFEHHVQLIARYEVGYVLCAGVISVTYVHGEFLVRSVKALDNVPSASCNVTILGPVVGRASCDVRGGLVCLNSAAGLISGIALPCVRPLRTRQALCQRTGPASFPQGSNGAVRHCKTRSTARVQFWLPGPIRRLSGTPPRT